MFLVYNLSSAPGKKRLGLISLEITETIFVYLKSVINVKF